MPAASEEIKSGLDDDLPPALAACLVGKLADLVTQEPGRAGWKGLKDDRGATAVHYAARSGSVEVVKWLVQNQGCKGNTRSRVGATPGLDAAATGKRDAFTWLLEHGGCKMADEDSSGATALHLAARYGHLELVKWLETTMEADLALTTKAGATPLHFASSRGDLDTVKFLVEKNPSVIDRQMETGVTATYLAAQEGHLESLRYLVEEGGAKLTVTSFDGMSCIHSAAQMGKLDCVAWMVMTGKLGIDDRDFDGATALHFAAGRGHLRVVEWLLVYGARIVQDNIGGSPLHDAAEHGQVKCVRALVQFGCDPTLKDNNGMTAADLAENCWHRDCAATIRRRMAKGVNGSLASIGKKRPSIRNYFQNGDYIDMSAAFRGSDYDGGSDCVEADSGSETSSTYVVHTDYSRSSGRSLNGGTGTPDYYNAMHIYRQPNGAASFHPRFYIPPPPSWPPPPVPPPNFTSRVGAGAAENAEVTSQQSTTSSQSETDYENLNAAELASLRHMHNAIEQHTHERSNTRGENGAGYWNGGVPIYGYGAITGHEKGIATENGIFPPGHHQANSPNLAPLLPSAPPGSPVMGSSLPRDIAHANAIYGTAIPMTRPQPIPGGSHGSGNTTGRMSPSHGGFHRGVVSRYQPVHDGDVAFSRVQMSPRLKEIIERDSEMGSRQASMDVLESATTTSPPGDLSIQESVGGNGRVSASAPSTPARQVAPPPPPAPPLPPPGTFTPPVNSLRWKKMAYGSLPNVSMSGEAAKFLLRPTVIKSSESGNSTPNFDLIAELKAGRGRESLKRVKRQEHVKDGDSNDSSERGTCDSDADSDPKSFWKQLQKRPSTPNSETGSSRRSSIALRPEFDPKLFVDKVQATDAGGNTIPAWKKQILARQMAEKAQNAADQQIKVEQEENKYKHLPMWKRALIEKKAKEKQQEKGKIEQKDDTENKNSSNGKLSESTKDNANKENESKLQKNEDLGRVIFPLKKTVKNFEQLDSKKKKEHTEEQVVAPWQLELKKKKKSSSFKDGFV